MPKVISFLSRLKSSTVKLGPVATIKHLFPSYLFLYCFNHSYFFHSFHLFCPSFRCLWMSVKIYFFTFWLFLVLSVYRKIKFICHSSWSAHSEEKSRNVDPDTNTGLWNNEPAERQAQKKRCYKWQPKLRKHCDISQDLWPLFQYHSPFSLIFIYYFHCA